MNIFVAGHQGMVGSAILRKLSSDSENNLFTVNHSDLDLTNQEAVEKFFEMKNFDQVYLAAARVGGIHANNEYPAEFIYENLMIQSNIIHSAHSSGVQKLLFLGSSCIYPKFAKQPMLENALLTDKLESTNEPYAIAKIAGIKMCESYNRQYKRDYRSIMPTNLYGPNDNFHPENSHVIPALMARIHAAACRNKDEVMIWGSGNAMREFLHVDDMAAASIYVMNIDYEKYASNVELMLSHINVGTGSEITIRQLAKKIAKVVGFKGNLIFDISKPDGSPRKLLDVSRLKSLGWSSSIELDQGLKDTYNWFLQNSEKVRK